MPTTHDDGAARTARLARLREQHSLTADDLVRITGRDRKSAYRWLGGRAHPIPEPVLRLIELTCARRKVRS